MKILTSFHLTSHPHTPLLRQFILLAQSAYAEQTCPFRYEHVCVCWPAGCISHPKSDVHCSSARHAAPNVPLATQSKTSD